MKIPKKISAAARRFDLTKRQTETLALLSEGKPWKCVADRMKISTVAVFYHVRAILKKTGAKNIVEAIAKIFLESDLSKNK